MNAAIRRSTAVKASGIPRRFLSTYKSPYGPKYSIPVQVEGWTIKDATRLGFTAAGFGASAGIFALFFFSDVPRVRSDILTKVPIIGSYWVKEIHPADNPF
ncbi:hypothetical protein B7463_g7854, partial [Scytalidium lignicola]